MRSCSQTGQSHSFLRIPQQSLRSITNSLIFTLKKSYLSQIPNLLKTIEEVGLRPDERQKVKSSNGAWFCTCDNKGVYYLGTYIRQFLSLSPGRLRLS